MPLDLFSPDFEDGDVLPEKFSAQGEDINPTLQIVDVPEDTEMMVMVFENMDTPDKTFAHWLVWNIMPNVTVIPEGETPLDAIEGYNDHGEEGYSGPHIEDKSHRYQFHLYALDEELEIDEDITRVKLEKLIAGHILDEVILSATYGGS